MKKLIAIIFFIPFIASASWWNPWSWNQQKTIFGAPVSNIFNNIIPSANQKFDLGTTTPANEWKNIYTQNLTVSGTCTGCGGGGGLTAQLGQIGDVSTTSPEVFGHILRFNNITSKWESVATNTLNISATIPANTYDVYGQATNTLKTFTDPYYATTTHPLMSSLPALSITASQVSNFGLAWSSQLAGTTTSALNEGTNLYYTDARARASLSSSATGLTYTSGTGVFSLTSGYEIPTSTRLINADTAYSWGNHALGGYFLSSNFNTSFDNRLSASSSISGLITAPNLSLPYSQLSGAFAYPFTATSLGNSTSTLLQLTSGFISTASSTVSNRLHISGQLNASSTLLVGGLANFYSNVGIGTSTPGALFAVQGNALVNGTLSSINLIATGTLDILNMSPTLRGSINIAVSDNAYDMVATNNYLYVTSYSSGSSVLNTYNISTSTPSLVSSLSVTNAVKLAVSGRYAYVATSDGKLFIVDISKPGSPINVGNVTTTVLGTAQGVYVSGRYAYTLYTGGFQIIDVSNPASPALLGIQPVANPTTVFYPRFSVYGKYAYIPEYTASNIKIVDISNPITPTVTGTTTLDGGSGVAVHVSGKYAYTVNGVASRMEIFDISTTTPSRLGNVPMGGSGNGWRVFTSGRYAYAADSSGNITIFDVSTPTAPLKVKDVTTGAGANPELYVFGRYLYIMGSSNKIEVYDLGGVESTSGIFHSLDVGSLQVKDNLSVSNSLTVASGLNVGAGGIFSAGPISVGIASSTQANAISAYFQGFVGIGSTSPSQLLSVHGNAFLSGNISNVANITATGTITSSGLLSTASSTFSSNLDLSGGIVKQHIYPSFSYSTSTAWTGTTTILLGPAFQAETWYSIKCNTDTGTVNLSFSDGTNVMENLTASTTVGTFNFATNNSFTSSEKRQVSIGNPLTTPTKVSCTLDKIIN